jgi:hypothetical protein
VTVVLITCSYREQEFVRVGYYVNNEYEEEYDPEHPPRPVDVAKLQRNILADKPRVTRFPINWGPTAGPGEQIPGDMGLDVAAEGAEGEDDDGLNGGYLDEDEEEDDDEEEEGEGGRDAVMEQVTSHFEDGMDISSPSPSGRGPVPRLGPGATSMLTSPPGPIAAASLSAPFMQQLMGPNAS